MTTARPANQINISFKEGGDVFKYDDPREIKICLNFGNGEINLGPYRMGDVDNINEMAGIVNRELESYEFRGDILIEPGASQTFAAVFRSNLEDRYKHGKIEIKALSADRSRHG